MKRSTMVATLVVIIGAAITTIALKGVVYKLSTGQALVIIALAAVVIAFLATVVDVVLSYPESLGRLRDHLINLRAYRKRVRGVGYVGKEPLPMPWHLPNLTADEVDRLVENRNKAWRIYYEAQERATRNYLEKEMERRNGT